MIHPRASKNLRVVVYSSSQHTTKTVVKAVYVWVIFVSHNEIHANSWFYTDFKQIVVTSFWPINVQLLFNIYAPFPLFDVIYVWLLFVGGDSFIKLFCLFYFVFL